MRIKQRFMLSALLAAAAVRVFWYGLQGTEGLAFGSALDANALTINNKSSGAWFLLNAVGLIVSVVLFVVAVFTVEKRL